MGPAGAGQCDRIFRALPEDAAAGLLTELLPAAAARQLATLEAAEREPHLARLAPAIRAEIVESMRYPPNSAGALMDSSIAGFAGNT
ncbi:MAG: hypothetical protein R3E48_20465 [Burkholderiaceae bacterium]